MVVAVSRPMMPRDAGQSLVEFAILIPILLGVVIGIFEFGRAWNVDQVLTNAGREGARLAVIPTSSVDDVVAAVLREPGGEEVRLVEQAADRALEQRFLPVDHLPRPFERLGGRRGGRAPGDLLEGVLEVDAVRLLR